MKTLSRLLMILLLILTLSSCVTTPEATPIEIPEFGIPIPKRPTLIEIPSETSSAIKTFVMNLSLLDGYVKSLELYVESFRKYHENILMSVNQR